MLLNSLELADAAAAVTIGEQSVSRAELAATARALAAALPTDRPVAVCAQPTLDTVIGVTACLLAGVPVAALEKVWSDKLRLNPGVAAFVEACQAAGLKTLLVSGGFTFFSERIRHQLKLDFARANTLGVANGRLTGTLFDRPWGDIVDGTEKKRVLLEVAELMGIDMAQTIAVGDGANDLPMMAAAGLSIAYHAKPAVREKAMIAITSGGLDRALEVLLPRGGANLLRPHAPSLQNR